MLYLKIFPSGIITKNKFNRKHDRLFNEMRIEKKIVRWRNIDAPLYNKIEEGRLPRGIRPSSHIFTKFIHCHLFQTVILLIPFRKSSQTIFNSRFRFKSKITLQFANISIRLINIARLHGQIFFLCCLTESFFQNFELRNIYLFKKL